MDQKISIKIAGRTYNLTSNSPDQEELFRLAADAINKRFAAYTQSHPGKTATDLLSLVALNETVFRLGLQREIDRYKSGCLDLERDLEHYLTDDSIV